jgi:hypothetical protein
MTILMFFVTPGDSLGVGNPAALQISQPSFFSHIWCIIRVGVQNIGDRLRTENVQIVGDE